MTSSEEEGMYRRRVETLGRCCRRRDPSFLETLIAPTSQVCESVWSIVFRCCLKVKSTICSSALTFRGGMVQKKIAYDSSRDIRFSWKSQNDETHEKFMNGNSPWHNFPTWGGTKLRMRFLHTSVLSKPRPHLPYEAFYFFGWGVNPY